MIRRGDHPQTYHDMEVQGLRFRQARILRDMAPDEQRELLLGGDGPLLPDNFALATIRDKLQRILLGDRR